MNKAIIFSIGMAAGGGIGTGMTILILKRKLVRQKDAEVEEVRAYYKQKIEELKAQIPKKEAEKAPENEEKEQKSEEKLSQKVGLAERNTAEIGHKKVQSEFVDYTKFSKIQNNYTGNNAKELFNYPHEITEDEFDNEEGYDKVILTYYENDDIMADINDRVSEYTVEDFGFENLSDFNFDNLKYLRNEKSKTDFKIIYEPTMSYDEATGGVNLNDP